jgi:hypothetical protein
LIKSYGSLIFLGEVQAGRACVRANQQELTTCAKKWRQEEKILFCKGWVWSTQPRHYQSDNLITFEFIYFSFLELWGSLGMGLAFWKNGCTTPHFLKLAPTLGSVKSSIPHGAWRFHFFPIFFLKLEDTLTFISIVGILVSWKSEITKNSTRIACVMEFLCTLLQCRVHLSMFHSSPTFNIWYTCT